MQNIFKRLFRVYAHIYYCHFERMTALGAEPHLNTYRKAAPHTLTSTATCYTVRTTRLTFAE